MCHERHCISRFFFFLFLFFCVNNPINKYAVKAHRVFSLQPNISIPIKETIPPIFSTFFFCYCANFSFLTLSLPSVCMCLLL